MQGSELVESRSEHERPSEMSSVERRQRQRRTTERRTWAGKPSRDTFSGLRLSRGRLVNRRGTVGVNERHGVLV
jgi:hypothetical protein